MHSSTPSPSAHADRSPAAWFGHAVLFAVMASAAGPWAAPIHPVFWATLAGMAACLGVPLVCAARSRPLSERDDLRLHAAILGVLLAVAAACAGAAAWDGHWLAAGVSAAVAAVDAALVRGLRGDLQALTAGPVRFTGA